MFVPKKTKYRKAFKGRMSSKTCSGDYLSYGEYGLKALGHARIDGKQIESARRCITRVLNRSGKVWLRVFPSIPVTKKPTDVRMGKGKGSVEKWVFRVSPGRILFEVGGASSKEIVNLALLKAASKLPFLCSVVSIDLEY